MHCSMSSDTVSAVAPFLTGPLTSARKWDTFDVAPYNLYNVIWRAQNWVLQNCDD